MVHTCTDFLRTIPPPNTAFFSCLIDIPLFWPLSLTNGAFDSVPNAVWAHKMVVVEEPPVFLFLGLTLGTAKRAGVMSPFRTLLGP